MHGDALYSFLEALVHKRREPNRKQFTAAFLNFAYDIDLGSNLFLFATKMSIL